MPNPFRFSRFLDLANRFPPAKIFAFLIHLPNFIRLFSRLLADPRVPFHLKFFCYFALFYFIFPIDLLKDLPFFQIGYIDDIIILIFAFRKLIKESPPEIVQEHVDAISQGK
ncbi:MAG: DUF1232 domain-containing protein [Candidatus Omnitrophica bacterium]|nr:DUF1232 domain-containing protein [Candidatus Omnitrophota bacterium]